MLNYLKEQNNIPVIFQTFPIDKIIRETGETIYDGLEIVCVNTKINDGTDIAELMQCFMQKEVNNPKFPVFTKRMNYLKNIEGGRQEMCRIMEEYVDEIIQGKIENALRRGKQIKDIADIFDVDEIIVEKIAENILTADGTK